jgi:hypothetical protein
LYLKGTVDERKLAMSDASLISTTKAVVSKAAYDTGGIDDKQTSSVHTHLTALVRHTPPDQG